MSKKRRYNIKVKNKGWFKNGNKPHNLGKPPSLNIRKKISQAVKIAMARLPEYKKRRIRKGQFKKGNYYAHWTGKYGEANPHYKGKAYRNKALAVKKRMCEKCGRTKFDVLTKLHVHHKDRNRLNNNIKNLKLLCSKCHLKLHKNWEYRWNKHGKNKINKRFKKHT